MPSLKNMRQERHIAGKKISKHAMEEFGVGMSEYIFCPKGEAVYYKKAWHHASDFFIKMPDIKEDKNVVFKLCPAHEMEKNKQYEGEVAMRDLPPHIKDELIRLIENMGERAMRLDVLHRILAIKWTGGNLRVTTSENQLAQKIGRKIKETFKKHIVEHIIHPKGGESDVVSVRITFIKKQE